MNATLTASYYTGTSFGFLNKVSVQCDGVSFTECKVNGSPFHFSGLPNHIRENLKEQAQGLQKSCHASSVSR